MLGVDPKKLLAVQESTKHMTSVITADYRESTVTISFTSVVPAAREAIPELLESFSKGLAQQLATYFAINGELIEVGKDDVIQPTAN